MCPNKKTFDVAIILVNYNNSELTLECIASIRSKTVSKTFIIVVDNNSNDINKLKSINKLHEDVFIINNKTNTGFGRANNQGITWAFQNLSFNYLLLLNNDTLLTQGSLDKLTKPFEKDSKIGITTSRILYEHNRDIVWYGGGEINFLRGKPKINDFNQYPSESGALKSKYVTFISGCTMMFSKRCIEDLKGFDEDYFMYGEDVELCIRATKMGYKLFYVSDSIIYHKVGGSLLHKSKHKGGLKADNPNLEFKFFHMTVNHWVTMRKHLKGIKFLIFNIIFWLELSYKVILLYSSGRTDILRTFIKCSKTIFEYEQTAD